MMEIVLLAGCLWAAGASILYLMIVTEPEPSVYKFQERILYENKEHHHFVITGRPMPKRLTQEQAFTNALIQAAQERKAKKRK